ncbi:MAG: type II CRISPR RNA-guided endonuclease Cas9 [Mariprofundaceae bacterium]|nr:type II CRISPR RNA-guided endonuclease Cas9 [Mariprofundaceae bacterium]
MAHILGLDLGTNSIGWALLEASDDAGNNITGMVDVGVRIFQEGVDRTPQGAEQSKNATRREKRGERKLHKRRNQRRNTLKDALIQNDLLPSAQKEFDILMQINPYELRSRGIDEKLSLFELGRALYHINQRRGFKSNRKSGESDGTVATALTELQQKMDEGKFQTLGQYLYSLNPKEQRIRGRYTKRAMYEEEFEILWGHLSSFYPENLTDSLKKEIKNVIFYQRPLKIQKFLIGICEFEKQEIINQKGEKVWSGKKRSPKGTWYAQQFRLLSEINNLKVIDDDKEWQLAEDLDLRDKLVQALQKKKTMNFSAIRKLLFGKGDQPYEHIRFNLEEGGRDKLHGNATEYALRDALKKKYDELTDQQRDNLVHDLLFLEDESIVVRHCEVLGFDEEITRKLLKIKLEDKYFHLSQKAIKTLLPFLEQSLKYSDAVEAAGYLRKDQKEGKKVVQLGEPPQLRNPIVQKALFEVRKVVNAIVREYGIPAKIRVEMARDLKQSAGQRKEVSFQNAKNRRRNDEIRERLSKEYGIANPSRDDVIKFRLWEECNHTCPYTNTTISAEMLFSSQVEIEHILPYSRSLDDSYINKTLCMSFENKIKGNQTPYEAYHADYSRYQTMLAAVRKFKPPFGYKKFNKFRQQKISLDSFIERQLNDTRYISREVLSYMEPLVGKGNVQSGRGQMTSTLRHLWGLNKILHASGEKTREDHRHHAVDAVVTALSTPKALKAVSAASKYGRLDKLSIEQFPIPWNGFHRDVGEKIQSVVVSHRVMRKIRGALHEETAYGQLTLTDDKNQKMYAVRKPVSALSHKEITQIADEKIRGAISSYILQKGFDPKDKGDVAKALKDADKNPPTMQSGQVIKKVRLHKPFSKMRMLKKKQGHEYRAMQEGNNHHIVIYEYEDKKGKTKRGGHVVSMFEAAQRARHGEPLVQRKLEDGQKFIMSLSINELVQVPKGDDEFEVYRVQKMNAATQITLRHNAAANINDNSARLLVMPNTFKGSKVVIDPLGQVYPAND